MRLHRFYVEQALAGVTQTILLDTELIHQLKNVFRLKEGERIVLFDGSGFEYLSYIISLRKNEAVVGILESRQKKIAPKRHLTLLLSLPKKDNFEVVLQKGTELGVSCFAPLISDRSEKKEYNEVRCMRIVREATEQSGRTTVPSLQSLISLDDSLGVNTLPAIALHAPDISAWASVVEQNPLPLFSASRLQYDAMAVYVGPEGGWSPREIALFTAASIPVLSLGDETLRTETAAIAVASLLLL